MDLPMNQDKLKNLIASIPTEQLKSDEIEPLIQQMRKHLIEQALQGEMDAHLGYDRYERHSGTNSRNGSSKKTLKTEKGPIAISVPRGRDGSFEPQIVPKGQTRPVVLDDQIIAPWMLSIRRFSWTVSLSKSVITNVWSIRPSLSHWGSICPVTKNYWVYGWRKMKGPSSGYRF